MTYGHSQGYDRDVSTDSAGLDVFVSYASPDSDVAYHIVEQVEATGLRCWVAPRDIRPGIDYAEGILDGIKRARTVLVLISAAALKSPHVSREIERAVNAGTPLLPARIEDVPLSGSLEYFVGSVHGIDALPDSTGRINVGDILSALGRHLGSEPKHPVVDSSTFDNPLPASTAAAARASTGAPPVDDSFSFVGRHIELEYSQRAIESALGGSRQIIAIGGEPGVGKTRLSTEILEQATSRGIVAGVGICDIDVPEPYQPVANAVARVLSQLPESLTTKISTDFPLVWSLISRQPVELSGSQAVERQQLFADFVGAIEAMASIKPMCLLLDDVQWATEDTVALTRHIARVLSSSPVIVLMTYRDSEVTQDHPVFGLLADLHRMQGTKQFRLTGLELPDIIALAEGAAGHELDDAVRTLARRLHTDTSGSPFFATQIIQHLVETGRIVNVDGRWTIDESDPLEDLPASVRDVVIRRVTNLDEATQVLLRNAAVIGFAFDLELLATISSQEALDVLDRLEMVVQAGLLEEVGLDRFRFRHQLTRVTLYEQISATRRAHLHRRIGEAIEQSGIEGSVEELAFHWSEAKALSDAGRVARYCRLAADKAMARHAPEDARRLYLQALQALDLVPDPDPLERCDLLLALGRVLRGMGDGSARATLEEAVAIARREGDQVRMSRAVTSMLRAGFLFSEAGVGDVSLVAMIDEVLPLTTGAARARLMAARAAERHWIDTPDTIEAVVNEALDIVRASDDPRDTVEVLFGWCGALAGPDYTHRRIELATEALQISRELKSLDLEAVALIILLSARYELADITVLNDLPVLDKLAEQVTDRTVIWIVKLFAIMRVIICDPAAGEEAAMESYQMAEASHQPEAFSVLSLHISEVAWHTGQLEGIVDEYRAEAEARPIMGLRSGFARVLLELGRDDEAREQLQWLADRNFESLKDINWLGYMSDVGLVVAALGTDEQRQLIYDWLEPYAGRFMPSFWFVANSGSVDRVLGLLAESLGDTERAKEHLTTALRMEKEFGHTVFIERCTTDLERLQSAVPPIRP